jgi:hypothetical protein
LTRFEPQDLSARERIADPYAAWLRERESAGERRGRAEFRWVHRYRQSRTGQDTLATKSESRWVHHYRPFARAASPRPAQQAPDVRWVHNYRPRGVPAQAKARPAQVAGGDLAGAVR